MQVCHCKSQQKNFVSKFFALLMQQFCLFFAQAFRLAASVSVTTAKNLPIDKIFVFRNVGMSYERPFFLFLKNKFQFVKIERDKKFVFCKCMLSYL